MLNEIEKHILKSLHLRGIMGNCGALNKKQRANILNKLLKMKLITDKCTLTRKGIELYVQR